MAELPIEGGCRCGEVRFRVSAAPLLTMACHCTGCQHMTASAFSLSAAIPADGFAVIAGQPVIGGLHGATRHHHCPRCKSWLFTRPEGMDWFVNVRPTMLDRPGTFAKPFVEVWTDERLPWATTAARHSYGRVPDNEEFGRLTAEYAAMRGDATS